MPLKRRDREVDFERVSIRAFENHSDGLLYEINIERSLRTKRVKSSGGTKSDQKKSVFVVYGRNIRARDAMYSFLRALGLSPLEWGQVLAIAQEPSPHIGRALEKAFSRAQAIVIILTGDDVARLGARYWVTGEPLEKKLTAQPRPNVLFEAGMAFGRDPRKAVLVQLGKIRTFSDIDGRHVVRLDNSDVKRNELINRLKSAGCKIDLSHKTDYLKEGDFEACVVSPDRASTKR